MNPTPTPNRPIDLDVLQRYVRNPDRFFVVCMMQRIGAMLFMTQLEYEHFPPGEVENKVFDLFVMEWEGMPFGVVGVPMTFRSLVHQVAEQTKMRLADGVPTLITVENGRAVPSHFPLQGRNIFCLENDPNHDIYLMSMERAAQREREALEAVIVQVIRRAAEAQSHVTQQLGAELEELLVALDGDVSRHDTLVRIWGPAARRPEKGEPGPMPAIAEEEQATV